MKIHKEISKDNEFYLYMNGELIYKKWLNTGYSKVFDIMAYDKYTHSSYTDLDVENSLFIINVLAKVKFKTALQGGRNKKVYNGYRPDHVFEYDAKGQVFQAFMGDIVLKQDEVLELGSEYKVRLRFVWNLRLESFLEEGRKWWMHEGPILVGEGEILSFLDAEEL